ncbi:addiction module antitoxin RelB [Spirochaetia bacterium]|nr:addiction module antitoxin RelB [Spirochaetia bacterium]
MSIPTPLDFPYSIGYTKNMITVRETEHFKTWIRAINDRQTKQIINARIRRISTGNFGDTKPVGDGISELRIDYGPGYRVYYIRRGDELVILLCGSDKSTQDETIKAAKKIAENLEGV